MRDMHTISPLSQSRLWLNNYPPCFLLRMLDMHLD